MNPGQMRPSDEITPSNPSSPAVRSEDVMEKASEAVREKTAQIAKNVEEKVIKARDYLTHTDLSHGIQDFKSLASRHPVASAAIGVAIGLFLGRLIPRR